VKLDELGQKKIPKWIVGVFFLFILFGVYDAIIKQNELEDYGVSSKAIITYIHSGNKGIRNIDYEFNVNGKNYIGHGEIPFLTCLPCEIEEDGCVGTEIDITYSKRDPEIVETNFSGKLIKIEDQDAGEIWKFLKDKIKGK